MESQTEKWRRRVYALLIITFASLYLCVAFVSTLHAITFFQLANTLGLAILLGVAYEIGQASVLFSILMTHNKTRALAWFMMILLTTLQVTANVYASFKFMDSSGSTDWTYWQRSILFWLEADGPEMYKITIAWITGALLPLVALGMTALVADNIKLMRGNVSLDEYEDEYEDEYDEELEETTNISNGIILAEKPVKLEGKLTEEKEISGDPDPPQYSSVDEHMSKAFEHEGMDFSNPPSELILQGNYPTAEEPNIIEPVKKPRGWHLKKEYIDEEGNVFRFGKFIAKGEEPQPPKKA